MSLNNLISFALILFSYKNKILIPRKNSKINFIGIIEGFKNISNIRHFDISFSYNKMILSFKSNTVKHCFIVIDHQNKENMIQLHIKAINGDVFCIFIKEIHECKLDNFICNIIIPKCDWDSKMLISSE